MKNDQQIPTPNGILDDSELNIPAFSKVCTYCIHWTPSAKGHYCAAFPTQEIPNSIWMGDNLHLQPVGGEKTTVEGQPITFKPVPGVKRTDENMALLDAYTDKTTSDV